MIYFTCQISHVSHKIVGMGCGMRVVQKVMLSMLSLTNTSFLLVTDVIAFVPRRVSINEHALFGVCSTHDLIWCILLYTADLQQCRSSVVHTAVQMLGVHNMHNVH